MAKLSQISKPKPKRWSGPLGNLIYILDPDVIMRGASDEEKANYKKAALQNERIEKLELLRQHYNVSTWHEVALCLAIEYVPGFQLQEAGQHARPGAPAKWAGVEGASLIMEARALEKEMPRLIDRLHFLYEVKWSKRSGLSFESFVARYHEAKKRHDPQD